MEDTEKKVKEIIFRFRIINGPLDLNTVPQNSLTNKINILQ